MDSESDESATLIPNKNVETSQRIARTYSATRNSGDRPDSYTKEVTSSDETESLGGKTLAPSRDEELAATWGGRRSQPDLRRLRRARSWSAEPHDDVSSEIRILRERLLRTQTRPRPGAVRFLSRRQRLTLASLALVDFMSFCSMSIMAPFFPREASIKGLSDTMCGLVFSFYAIVMFLTSPIFGKFLPLFGTKFMFMSGMFVAGACNVLFGTLVMVEDTVTFTALCFMVRGLEALGASAYSTASYVFVVHAFPDSIGSVLGILETFVGLGMSVGPAIGGLLYSIGGFGLPFYSLGIIMVLTVPINYYLLVDTEEYTTGSKSGSILRLFKIPSIIITGMVIVIVSNTWAFLDPTLEPHLRQFGLSTQQIGLIFLLFSSLYGISSPLWGWVADRVHNHWCMMVWGLFLSTLGLLLLGPCPFIPALSKDLWLDLVALSIIGVSVALTLLPTFQGVLTSSIYEGGCPEALATYSAVAGVWSCCYSLGEVLGPALGGALVEVYGFSMCATFCAAACFVMGIITLIFFSLRESKKISMNSDSLSDSASYTDTTWTSNACGRTRSAPEYSARGSECSPLLTPCSCYSPTMHYGTSSYKHVCLKRNKTNKNGAASIVNTIAYFLKFEYFTRGFAKLRTVCKAKPVKEESNKLYQNYLKEEEKENTENKTVIDKLSENNNDDDNNLNAINPTELPREGDQYVKFIDNYIFGSPSNGESVDCDHLVVKKNHRGLLPTLLTCGDDRRPSEEIIKHNLEKVLFYEQSPVCASLKDVFEGCECRDDVTFVRGTVGLSSTGACEV